MAMLKAFNAQHFLYAITILLLCSCKNYGCKTPDEISENWVSASAVGVMAINPDVISGGVAQNGAMYLKEGVTENVARDKLWVSPTTFDKSTGKMTDVIVSAGQYFKVQIPSNYSIVLKGSSVTSNILTNPVAAGSRYKWQKDDSKLYGGTLINGLGNSNGLIPMVKVGTFKPKSSIIVNINMAPTSDINKNLSTTLATNDIATIRPDKTNFAYVKSTGCDGSNTAKPCQKYIPLQFGQGLMVQLVPRSSAIPSANLYNNPDAWQCHLGASGSYSHLGAKNMGDEMFFGSLASLAAGVILPASWINPFLAVAIAGGLTPYAMSIARTFCTNSYYSWNSGYEFQQSQFAIDGKKSVLGSDGSNLQATNYHRYDIALINDYIARVNSSIVISLDNHQDYMQPVDSARSEVLPTGAYKLSAIKNDLLTSYSYIQPVSTLSRSNQFQSRLGPFSGFQILPGDSTIMPMVASFNKTTADRYFNSDSSMHDFNITSSCDNESACDTWLSSFYADKNDKFIDSNSVTHLNLGRLPFAYIYGSGMAFTNSYNVYSPTGGSGYDAAMTYSTPLKNYLAITPKANDTPIDKMNQSQVNSISLADQCKKKCIGCTNSAGSAPCLNYSLCPAGYNATLVDSTPEDINLCSCQKKNVCKNSNGDITAMINYTSCPTGYNLTAVDTTDDEKTQCSLEFGNSILAAEKAANNLKNTSYKYSNYFARCTHDWRIPKWMLLNASGDLSQWMNGDNAVSGAFFGDGLTTDMIKAKHNIASVHGYYGGIVSNAVYKQSCQSFGVNKSCTPTNVDVFYPSITAPYDRQIVLLKNLNNDPINTFPDDCVIKMSIGGTVYKQTINMAEPYSQGDGSFTDSWGDQYSGSLNSTHDNDRYFIRTRPLRNLVGSGVIKPEWHQIGGVISKGTTVTLEPDDSVPVDKTFFNISNFLAHDATENCQFTDSASGKATFGTLILPGVPIALGEVYKHKASRMNPTRLAGTERKCGTGIAFRVLPIAPMVCKSGYKLTCTNQRINSMVNTAIANSSLAKTDSDYTIGQYCQTQQAVGNDVVDVGQCTKRVSYTKSLYKFDPAMDRIQRYQIGNTQNANTMIDVDKANNWTNSENIRADQCGICVDSSNIYTYNGTNFVLNDSSNKGFTVQGTVTNSTECKNASDGLGNNLGYQWLTNYSIVDTTLPQSFTNIIVSSFMQQYNNNNSVFNATTYPANSTYSQRIYNAMKVGDVQRCPTELISLYGLYLKNISDSNVVASITGKINNLVTSTCATLQANAGITDNHEVLSLVFTRNQQYAACSDKPDQALTAVQSSQQYNNATSYAYSDTLSKFGVGGMYPVNGIDNQMQITIPSVINGVAATEVDMLVGFIPSYNDDVMQQYQDYKIDSADDTARGYSITVGDGLPVTKGKYLYMYIQPLKPDGTPDPAYDPNILFSPFNGVSYDSIVQNKSVYSFKQYDISNVGYAKIPAKRNGKLWYAILDLAKDPVTGSDNVDANGRAIVFANDGDNNNPNAQVKGQNYSSFNTGGYVVQTKVQMPDNNGLSDILQGITGGSDGQNVRKGLVSLLIVGPLKKVLFGTWCGANDNSSECNCPVGSTTDSAGLCIFNNSSICPANYTMNGNICVREDGKRLSKIQNDYIWEDGLIYFAATLLTKNVVIQLTYYIIVVLSVVITGLKVVFGSEKLSIADIKGYGIRFAIIATLASPNAWNFYETIIVKNVINFLEGFVIFSTGNFVATNTYITDRAAFVDIAFASFDKIYAFILKPSVFEQLIAIIFSSLSGTIIVIIIIGGVFVPFFKISIDAIVTYIFGLVKLSIFLCFGPIASLALVRPETKDIFDNWWKSICGIIAEQVLFFVGISIFGILIWNLLQTLFNFTICWYPWLKIPYINLVLIRVWQIAGTLPPYMGMILGDQVSAASNIRGFSIVNAVILYMVVKLMGDFLKNIAKFGYSVFGAQDTLGDTLNKAWSELKEVADKQYQALTEKMMGKKNK